MSYISKKGRAAAESATQEAADYSKALVSFKSGTTLNVRVPSTEDFVEYRAASVFKVFYTTPVTDDNLYDQAKRKLYDLADAATTEAEAEELREKARLINPKQRYLFGFINLDDGQPIIVDVSRKQAQTLISAIDKFAKRIDKVAFELSKEGSGQSTTVSLTPILDMDEDLTDKQRENFNKSAETEITEELYGKVLAVKSRDEQIDDIEAFDKAFKTNLIEMLGLAKEAGGEDVLPISYTITEDDLPF